MKTLHSALIHWRPLGSAILLAACVSGAAAIAEPRSSMAITLVAPPTQACGTTLVELGVSGSFGALASIRVEYEVLGDNPDRGWRLARAVEDARTEEFGLRDMRLDRGTTPLAFFWNTDVDLPDRTAHVRLRFTPVDGTTKGAPLESAAFEVDNG